MNNEDFEQIYKDYAMPVFKFLMKLSGDLENVKNIMETFYPDKIPENAEEITYYYERYSTLFSEKMDVKASWILPGNDYNTVKKEVLNHKLFKDSTIFESNGNGIVTKMTEPAHVKIIFEYNDSLKRVTYQSYASQNY